MPSSSIASRNPPRWFVPALFGAMLLAVAGLAGLGAWLYDPPNDAVKIGSRAYVVPPSALASLALEPKPFIRIAPPDEAYEIVHDSQATDRRDRTGVPHIHSVNDGASEVRYSRKGRFLIACRQADAGADADAGCGTWIDHGGATWSVLFAESRIADAETFAWEAGRLLRRYDTRPSGVLP